MQVQVSKINNNLAIQLNQDIIKSIGLKENDILDLQIIDNKLVLLKKENLEDLLSKINNNNLHKSIDFGKVGKELL